MAQTTGRPDSTTLTQHDNAAIVRRVYESFNERDLDGGATLQAPDAEIVDRASGQRFRGPAGYKESMQRWLDAFPDGKVEITNIMACGESVVVEFIGRGTQTGPLVGPGGTIPATGRQAELAFCDVLSLRDGMITGARSYYDSATMLRQLGAMPK